MRKNKGFALEYWRYYDPAIDLMFDYDRDSDGKLYYLLDNSAYERKYRNTKESRIYIDEFNYDQYQDLENYPFGLFIRKIGPYTCYLSNSDKGWRWEIVCKNVHVKPLWDVSFEVFPFQSDAAVDLFETYPLLYNYRKVRKGKK